MGWVEEERELFESRCTIIPRRYLPETAHRVNRVILGLLGIYRKYTHSLTHIMYIQKKKERERKREMISDMDMR